MAVNKIKRLAIFDSGLGGLTVLNKILTLNPDVQIYYLGDTARLPYGTKSILTVQRYILKCIDFLKQFEPDILIIACHTASVSAGDVIRKSFKGEIFDMKTSTIQLIKKQEKSRVGIIGTRTTINSNIYQQLFLDSNFIVYSKHTNLFVSLVEENIIGKELTFSAIDYYLNNWREKIDALFLGCTHFPLLSKDLIKYFQGKVTLLDPADMILESLKDKISSFSKNYEVSLYFTDLYQNFEERLSVFLGGEDLSFVKKIEKVDI